MSVPIDFNDLSFIGKVKKIDLKYPDKIEWPEEGWFVGITNSGWSNNNYDAQHFYGPSLRNDGDAYSWGGYMRINEANEYERWWTMNYNYGVPKEIKRFCFQCEDKDTAEKLANLLNYLPVNDPFNLGASVASIDDNIKELELQKKNIQKLMWYVNGGYEKEKMKRAAVERVKAILPQIHDGEITYELFMADKRDSISYIYISEADSIMHRWAVPDSYEMACDHYTEWDETVISSDPDDVKKLAECYNIKKENGI